MIFTYKDKEYVGIKKSDFERMFYTTLPSTNMVLIDESKSKKDVESKSKKDIRVIRTESGKSLWVKGDTESIKDKLIELGGDSEWDGTERKWTFSLKKEDELLRVLGIKKKDIVDKFNRESNESEESFSKSNESEESYNESKEESFSESEKSESKETNKLIRVGDYFKLIVPESGITSSYYPSRVTKVYTQSKVKVEVRDKEVIITKRRDNKWREEGKNKKISSGREIGNIYTYTGKDKPKTVVNPYYD